MKHAVVFSGGGAKGVYQAYEFVRQLEEGLSPPDVIYGTSVGAINAAAYAYYGPKMLDLWLGIRGRFDIMRRNWNFWKATGMYNSEPLNLLLEQWVHGTPRCEAVASYVSLIDRKVSYVSNRQVSLNEFREAVRSSASIPFAISPMGVRVDGGVREVTPLHQAILEGSEKISVFLCNPYSKDPLPDSWALTRGFFPALKIGLRAIEIMEHEVFINDIETCLQYNRVPGLRKVEVRVFCPKPQDMFIETLDFDPVKIRRVIAENIRMEDVLDTMEKNLTRKSLIASSFLRSAA